VIVLKDILQPSTVLVGNFPTVAVFEKSEIEIQTIKGG
jgi:hypothetical protein